VQDSVEQAAACSPGGGELRFQLVAHRHQFIHLGDDAVLFGEGRKGKRTTPQPSHVDGGQIGSLFRCTFKVVRPAIIKEP